MENKIQINGKDYSYVIIHKKIKNIYFRVKEDGIIYVTCSKLVSKKYIKELLKQNEKAIIKMTENMANQQKKDEELFFLGNKLTLINYNGRPFIRDDVIYAENISAAKEYLYSLAPDIFNERLASLRPLFKNLPNFTLKSRKMTSKWGVCNKRSMTVTLNTYLVFKKPHLIDYVIIHELCHFKYMDHSQNFWNYVASFYPNYKEARKELNNS